MVVCLERGADLHIAQLMPLPPTVSCFSKIQIGFTFLVAAHLGSPGQRAVKRVCVWYYLMQGIISSNASVIVQSGNNYAEKLWVDISSMDGTFRIQTNVPARYVSVEYQVTTSLQNRGR